MISLKEIKPELFAFICFQVLMSHGEGVISKSPSYVLEKMEMLNDGWHAMGRLDYSSQAFVMAWMTRWGVWVPDEVKKYVYGTYATQSQAGQSFGTYYKPKPDDLF